MEGAMLETLCSGAPAGTCERESISRRWRTDSARAAARQSRSLSEVGGAEQVPALRCRTIFNGIAVDPPAMPRWIARCRSRRPPRRSILGRRKNGRRTSASPCSGQFPDKLGRRGYEATTVRDIAAAAGVRVGSVYRLIGSKDELLASIMRSFTVKARSGWASVLRSEGTSVEKLDALMWININAVVRFSDEYNIQLAWIRESPPNTTNLGASFAARLNDLKSLLAKGIRSGDVQLEGPSADIRAWSLFELLWMPENIVRKLGPRGALTLARETTLRGAAKRP